MSNSLNSRVKESELSFGFNTSSLDLNDKETIEDEIHLLRLREDKDYFWELWEIYEKKVFSYCLYRLSKNYHDAEDLCSETMLKAYCKLPEASMSTNIYPWLLRVCRNRYFDSIRRSNVFKRILEEVEEEKITVELSEFFQKEKNIATIFYIRKVIDLLPSKTSHITRKYFFEESSYREISLELDCTEAYVRKQIFKVRGYLTPAYRRYMNEY